MAPTSTSDQPSRRQFLAALGGTAAGAGLAPTAEPPRDLQPTGANLGSLFPDVDRLTTRTYPYSYLSGRFKTLDDFKQAARAKVLDVFLHRPDKVEPRPEILDRSDMGDYVREKIVFSTTPQFRVPAYVLIPKKTKFPAPAIIDLHSHGGMFLFGKEKVIDLGTNHPTMVEYHQRNYDGRPTATALVRRGYVVISIDTFMFGERRLLLDADLKYGWDRAQYSKEDVQHLNQQCRTKETTLAKSLAFAGLTWQGLVCWDDMRTVDYLLTRKEVDPKRIGCVGISMGGHRSFFLAGMDERIAAACVVGFMSTVGPMLQAHVDTHSWVHFLPTLHQHLDWPDVASLMAPKPLLVQQCWQDRLFPVTGMKNSVTQIAAAYEKAGIKDRFTGRFYEAPHIFNRAMQDDAFAWFDKQFGMS